MYTKPLLRFQLFRHNMTYNTAKVSPTSPQKQPKHQTQTNTKITQDSILLLLLLPPTPISSKTMAANNLNSHLILALISLFFILSIPKSLSDFEPEPEPEPKPAPPTVWDILPKYGLPSGLLPSTVTDFSLQNDGRFMVFLESPCCVQFEYLVYYEKTITGKLGYGSITDLKGIQVHRFFFWFDVDEIKVDLPPSDSIYFQFGLINRKLDVDQFKIIHSCRDGVIGSCGYSWKSVLQLPMPTNEIQMLITE